MRLGRLERYKRISLTAATEGNRGDAIRVSHAPNAIDALGLPLHGVRKLIIAEAFDDLVRPARLRHRVIGRQRIASRTAATSDCYESDLQLAEI